MSSNTSTTTGTTSTTSITSTTTAGTVLPATTSHAESALRDTLHPAWAPGVHHHGPHLSDPQLPKPAALPGHPRPTTLAPPAAPRRRHCLVAGHLFLAIPAALAPSGAVLMAGNRQFRCEGCRMSKNEKEMRSCGAWGCARIVCVRCVDRWEEGRIKAGVELRRRMREVVRVVRGRRGRRGSRGVGPAWWEGDVVEEEEEEEES
ncbi:hypothetical protein MMC27_003699 [Xylographa pallens]|nr:hypothetical protein [Xylographa pallens]